MKKGHGVIMNFAKEPLVTGYLVIGARHYEIYGHRVSEIRTNLQVRQVEEQQDNLFDERHQTCQRAD